MFTIVLATPFHQYVVKDVIHMSVGRQCISSFSNHLEKSSSLLPQRQRGKVYCSRLIMLSGLFVVRVTLPPTGSMKSNSLTSHPNSFLRKPPSFKRSRG